MNTNYIRIIAVLAYVILAPILGAFFDGLDRKISARMQRRVGPPITQALHDLKKLFAKENVNVNKAQSFLILSYLVGTLIAGALFFSGGDMLMSIFLFSTSTMFLYFTGMVATSPYSTVGANRELLQALAYEPAELLTAVGFYLAVGSFKSLDIVSGKWSAILFLPGFFVAFVFILTIKMRKSPFDESTSHHPHQELIKGITSDLGARNYAIYTLTEYYENMYMLGVVALFFVNSNPWSYLGAVVAIFVLYFLEILIDNSSARVKSGLMIKQAWWVTFIAAGLNLLILMLIK